MFELERAANTDWNMRIIYGNFTFIMQAILHEGLGKEYMRHTAPHVVQIMHVSEHFCREFIEVVAL